ncbi:MAG: DUF3313 family protein [Xanthomonadales bacterium]|nr:DUF3313 domain-containing protein [Xanthomonadales bacterium]NIX13856.1 DUF3313 family protein [Xanthomonadales bacterium]
MRLRVITALLAGLVLSTSSMAREAYPEVTEEGLEKIRDTGTTLVYAKPGVDLGVYEKVRLLDAGVAFRKNWQRDQNRFDPFKVDKRDMERMRTELAGLFREVFTEKLTAAGHELVAEADGDVLIVRPAIVNLDVTAPDVNSPSRSVQLAESAGQMTLYVELYDSVTGDILVKALDHKADRRRGNFHWQTRGANRQAAEAILNTWADALVEALGAAQDAVTGEE